MIVVMPPLKSFSLYCRNPHVATFCYILSNKSMSDLGQHGQTMRKRNRINVFGMVLIEYWLSINGESFQALNGNKSFKLNNG